MRSRFFDADDVRDLIAHLNAFRGAFQMWLETQDPHEDSRRSAKRATTRTREDAEPGHVARLAAAVSVHEEPAALGVDLASQFVPEGRYPGLNAAREWKTMSAGGARVNPSDVSSTTRAAAKVLGLLLDRPARGLALLPVPDPTVLHPFAWSEAPVEDWVQERYSRLPATLARAARSRWAHRLGLPRYPDGVRLWEGLLSDEPPAPRQPRLRVPDLGDPDATTARQHGLAAALDGLDRLSATYDGSPTAPQLGPDDVGPWLHSWSMLLNLLEDCTALLASDAAREPTAVRTAAAAVLASDTSATVGERIITVDDTVFAPIPDPQYPEIWIGAHETVAVTSIHPDPDIATALTAAAARIALVDSDGTEHPDHDTKNDLAAELHTPSWVTVLTDEHGHPFLYADCQGAIPEPMGTTMRRILHDELHRTLTVAHAHPTQR
jgi:hypothetical protein